MKSELDPIASCFVSVMVLHVPGTLLSPVETGGHCICIALNEVYRGYSIVLSIITCGTQIKYSSSFAVLGLRLLQLYSTESPESMP